ncbi:MAG: hypothetical protein AB7H77_04250 [Bdellovibrionales bacterium]
MSYRNMDRVFPILSQRKTAQIIGEILRKIYGGNGSSVKAIAAVTPADLRTIKSWYEGRNVPNLSHFLELCVNAPIFLSAILKAIGHADLAKQLDLSQAQAGVIENPGEIEVYSISFDTINSAECLDLVRQLSIRQVWFYGEIRKGNRPSIEDLIRFWAVGEATAKRDLSDLVRLGLIRFVGSRRNGHYSL